MSPLPVNAVQSDKPTPRLSPIDITQPMSHSVFQAQRILCGWKHESEYIAEMFRQMSSSERCLFWVCIGVDVALSVDPSLASLSSPSHSGGDGEEERGKDEIKALVISKDGGRLLSVRRAAGSSREKVEGNSVDGEFSGSDRVSSLERVSGKWCDDVGGFTQDQIASGSGRNRDDGEVLVLPVLKLPDSTISSSATTKLYVPVGHISLDYSDFDSSKRTPLLGSGDGRIIGITTLFILPVFRKLGLGTSSMRQAEEVVRSGSLDQLLAPFIVTQMGEQKVKRSSCEVLALTTLAERHYVLDGPTGKDMWKLTGMVDVGKRTDGQVSRYLGGWYKDLGYERVGEMEKYKDRIAVGGDTGKDVYWYAEVWNKKLM